MENFKESRKHTDPDTTELASSHFSELDDSKMNTETRVRRIENLSNPKLKQEYVLETRFPPFIIMRTDILETQKPDYREIFLEDIQKYPNQGRSRTDFLEYLELEHRSCQGYSSIKAKILEFEGKNKDWEINDVLEWYTKDGSLKQIISDALKIGTWDAIYSCRWVLNSLKNKIKEFYQKKTRDFSGILFKKVLINHSEWEKLKKGIGKHIQLYDFLSVKKLKHEIQLLDVNNDEWALLSIIVPSFLNIKDEKTFAELGIQDEDGKQGEELLFNIMSKFRILEAKDKDTNGSNQRHLVLLFGDYEIQQFLKTEKPIIEVKIDKTKMICQICASDIDITQVPVFYIDLCNTSQYACKQCIRENRCQSKAPLLCVYSPTQLMFDSSGQNNLSLIIDGCATQYRLQDQYIPFTGYKCLKCLGTDFECFYKCLSCLKPNRSLCSKCMDDKLECVEKGHLIILERQAFTFWSTDVSEEELNYLRNSKGFSNPYEREELLERTTRSKELEKCLSKLGNDYNLKMETSSGMANKSEDNIKEESQMKNQSEEDMSILHNLFSKFQETEKQLKSLVLDSSSNITDKNAMIEEVKDNMMVNSEPFKKEAQNEEYITSIIEYLRNLDEVDDIIEKFLEKDLRGCLLDSKFEQDKFRDFIEALKIFKTEYQIEIIISKNLEKIHEYFFQEIIWYNQNNHSQELIEYKNKLEATFTHIKYFTDWNEASQYIKQRQQSIQILLSGIEQEVPIEDILSQKNISCVILFGDSLDNQEKLAKKSKIVHNVGCNFKKLEEKIKSNLLRLDFPAFTPIFDDMDTSDINDLHIYLNAFANFHNRRQSKRDFITLANQIFPNNLSDIKEFEKRYNRYNAKNILEWYTNETFLYRLLNNCLRIATIDSILYCRLVLSDIQRAIKEEFQNQKDERFNGVLYRGAYITEEEWSVLQKNIGKDIEMLGFLSASKSLEVATTFFKGILIKIIVPPAPYLGQQGFINLSQISNLPAEEEILFNVMSRFTILEADEFKGSKNLVLLYGAQELKMDIKLNKPIIEVIIPNSNSLKCHKCGSLIRRDENSSFYVDLFHIKEYVCQKCFENLDENCSTFMYISRCNKRINEADGTIKFSVEGRAMKYKNEIDNTSYRLKCKNCKMGTLKFYKCLDCENTRKFTCENCYYEKRICTFWRDQIASYRFKCQICKKETLKFYKCLDCKNTRKFTCENCYDNKRICMDRGHLIIVESMPFTYWNEEITQRELDNREYQKELCQKVNHVSKMNNILEKTGKHKKLMDFNEKILHEIQGEDKKVSIKDDILIADCFNNVGFAYRSLGDYKKAIEFFEKSLEIRKSIFGMEHCLTAASFNNVGSVYYSLGDYKKAIQFFEECLKIKKSIFGEKHPQTAGSFNNVGLAYKSSGKYKTAIQRLEKSLEIAKSIFGEKHPDTAVYLNSVGMAYKSLSQYKKAMEYLKKSLEIRVSFFGEKNPQTAISFNNVGTVYESLEKHKKAIKYFDKSLEIRRSIFGERHPDLANSLNNLGSAYLSLGEYEKAIEFLEKSLEITRLVDGDDHPNTATCLNNIGMVYGSLKQYEKAFASLGRSFKIRKSVLGDKHPDTELSIGNILLVWEDAFGNENIENFLNPKDNDPHVCLNWAIYGISSLDKVERK